MDFLTAESLSALIEIVMINLVLSGDNAIVIGLAAAGLPAEQRGKAILAGIVAATVLRIIFAAITQQLLGFGGFLLVAGGLLLLYVCWKMWSELRHAEDAAAALAAAEQGARRKTLAEAVWQIVIADVSMSLDNVLAVAGAAGDNTVLLVIGLVLSIALMGLAANLIARLLQRYRWIGYVGLAIIFYVALKMLVDGINSPQVWPGSFDWLPAFMIH